VEDVDEALHVGQVKADGGFFDKVEVVFGVLEAEQGAALAGVEFGKLPEYLVKSKIVLLTAIR
jgi:hypothetical protein